MAHVRFSVTTFLIILYVSMPSLATTNDSIQSPIVLVYNQSFLMNFMEEMASEFCKNKNLSRKIIKLEYTPSFTGTPFRLLDKKNVILLYDAFLLDDAEYANYQWLLDGKTDKYLAWQLKINCITNKNSPLKNLSIKTLTTINPQGYSSRAYFYQAMKSVPEINKVYGDEVVLKILCALCIASNKGTLWKGLQMEGQLPYIDKSLSIINEVVKENKNIGFMLYSDKDFLNIKLLNIFENKAYALTNNKPIIETDYPLQLTYALYLSPNSTERTKEFCKFAVGPEGAKIAAKYGLITPYAEKQYLADKYVKMMKAGEGPAVGMTGPVNLRMLVNGLVLESVKANGPVQLKFSEANESTAINSFLNRDDVYMLLLDSRPSERTMKLVATSWKKVQPVEYIIGGEAMAVIVNPANTATSLTPDQIRGLFSRQIKDWRFVAAKTAEGNGTARVECFGERLNTPAAQLFIDTVMPSSKIVGVKYRKTAGGVIASVAIDAGGVGFANAAMIDPADKAVRIVPIGLQEKSVLPTEETIMNGQYPFSRKLYLYVKPNAPEAVETIVKFILSPQAVEGFKTNGYFPLPQPKPATQTQPVKHHNKAATTQPAKPTAQPVTPATTQPTTKPATPTVPTTQPGQKAA